MVKIVLDATFSGIPLTESFLREATFEISIFNLTHKVPPKYVI